MAILCSNEYSDTFFDQNSASPQASIYIWDLLEFNLSLSKESRECNLNTPFLEKNAERLEEIGRKDCPIYLLTLARVCELALFYAGMLADNCEFTAVGDLLFNPRQVNVHIRGELRPLRKERHSRMTGQFCNVSNSREGVVDWLKNNTFLETKKNPLITELFDAMESSGELSEHYLESVRNRIVKISEATAFLAVTKLTVRSDFNQCIQFGSSSDRKFVESKLCGFDKQKFAELWHDIQQLLNNKKHKSNFLRR